jgi:hypothetical protein
MGAPLVLLLLARLAVTTKSSKATNNSTVRSYLFFQPEGIRKEYTQGTFFCPGSKGNIFEQNLLAKQYSLKLMFHCFV